MERLQPRYFASFLLGTDPTAKPPKIHHALEEITKWVFEDRKRPKRVQFLTLRKFQAAAVRLEQPHEPTGGTWRAECVLSKAGEGIRFAASLAFDGSAPTSRPRIVRDMIDKFGGRERYPLKGTFSQVKSEDVESFAGFLLDGERELPAVFVSRSSRDDEILYDRSPDLDDRLAGIAHVCVADNGLPSRWLADHIGDRLNTDDGSVRVYMPRMAQNDPPSRHALWTRQDLVKLEAEGRSLADELLRRIAIASVERRVPGLVRWDDVEREIEKQWLTKVKSTEAVMDSED